MRPEALAESLAATIKALVEPLAARVTELEARAPVPGPEGPMGPAGPAGLNGKDGAQGLTYCGVHVAGKTYDAGTIVTAGGSAFHCERETTATPGSSHDWTLMVKRGRDGKDAK
jgi:hypothetical protein